MGKWNENIKTYIPEPEIYTLFYLLYSTTTYNSIKAAANTREHIQLLITTIVLVLPEGAGVGAGLHPQLPLKSVLLFIVDEVQVTSARPGGGHSS